MTDKMVLMLFKTKTKQFEALTTKYVHIHNKNVLNVLDSLKKCIQKKQ